MVIRCIRNAEKPVQVGCEAQCHSRVKKNVGTTKESGWPLEKKAFFDGKKCEKCDSSKNLQLDHIDPATKVSHKIWSWSVKRREEELAKCQILCLKCHKEKTKKWWLANRKHGRTWYNNGCRCDICYKAQQSHNAQRYAV